MREGCYAKIRRLAAGMLASAPQFEGYRVCRAAFDRVSAARDRPPPQPVKKRGRSI
jgi:hypothetical protein